MTISFSSDPVEIAPVRTAVEALAARHGFDETAVGEIGLVVNEAVANIIRHAYHNRTDGRIELTADVENNQLSITLRDWGDGTVPDANRVKINPLTPGGLGIPCMRQMTDSLQFIKQSDGMLLKLTRLKR
jgi:serine/threonine-protein kinase RsbW